MQEILNSIWECDPAIALLLLLGLSILNWLYLSSAIAAGIKEYQRIARNQKNTNNEPSEQKIATPMSEK